MTRISNLHAADDDTPASGDASESSDPQVVDLDELLGRCMGNLDLVERVLQKFQDTFPGELAELESAFEAGSAEQLTRTAHRIKGTSASVSVVGLQHAAAELEELCCAGRMKDVPGQIDRLRHEWNRYLKRKR